LLVCYGEKRGVCHLLLDCLITLTSV
jgi:hypothetical protein